MLDSAMKDQLSGIFSGLVSQYVFDIQVAPDHESRQELIDLLSDVASCSDHLSCNIADGEGLQFTIVKTGCLLVSGFVQYPTAMNLHPCCWLS